MDTETLPVLDEAAIAQLRSREIRGRNMLAQMLLVFEQEAPELVDGMRHAIEGGNLDSLYQYCHKLKGISAVMGAKRVWGYCNEVIEIHDRGALPSEAQLETIQAAVTDYLAAVAPHHAH